MIAGEEGLLEAAAADAGQTIDEEWAALGEVPQVEPAPFRQAVLEHFEQSAANLAGNVMKTDHEVVTTLDNKLIAVIKDRKKEIELTAGAAIAGLAVYGILRATRQLHVKRRK